MVEQVDKVCAELVRSKVRTANPLIEKEIVEHDAATKVEEVRRQTRVITQRNGTQRNGVMAPREPLNVAIIMDNDGWL